MSSPYLYALYIGLVNPPNLANPLFKAITHPLYLFYIDCSLLSNPVFGVIIGFSLPAIGIVYADDLEDPRFGILLRSSTDEGGHGASRSHQKEVLETAVARSGGTITKTIDVVESAKSMDRESLNELLELAEQNKIDVIGVMEIDRLTRAPVFEAIEYYRKLEENNCLLYASSIGYIDLVDLNDKERLISQTFFSRRWYIRIQEGAKGSIVKSLEDGKYPFGGSPVGFETNNDHSIWVKNEEREFMYRAFQTYLRVENRAEALRILNRKRGDQGKSEISDSQLRTLLESRLCIGQFEYEGMVWHTDENLRVVPDEMYLEVQELLRNRRETRDVKSFPEFVSRAGQRYGIDYIISIIESLKGCRECGESRLKKNGTCSVMGYTLQSYRCSNPNCGFQGPVLFEEEIRELHQTNPSRCHRCPATDQFKTKEIHKKDLLNEIEETNLFLYTCRICGSWFISPDPPGKIERALKHPEEMFDIEESYQKDNGLKSEGVGGKTDQTTIDDNQSCLSTHLKDTTRYQIEG